MILPQVCHLLYLLSTQLIFFFHLLPLPEAFWSKSQTFCNFIPYVDLQIADGPLSLYGLWGSWLIRAIRLIHKCLSSSFGDQGPRMWACVREPCSLSLWGSCQPEPHDVTWTCSLPHTLSVSVHLPAPSAAPPSSQHNMWHIVCAR